MNGGEEVEKKHKHSCTHAFQWNRLELKPSVSATQVVNLRVCMHVRV